MSFEINFEGKEIEHIKCIISLQELFDKNLSLDEIETVVLEVKAHFQKLSPLKKQFRTGRYNFQSD